MKCDVSAVGRERRGRDKRRSERLQCSRTRANRSKGTTSTSRGRNREVLSQRTDEKTYSMRVMAYRGRERGGQDDERRKRLQCIKTRTRRSRGRGLASGGTNRKALTQRTKEKTYSMCVMADRGEKAEMNNHWIENLQHE